LHQSVDRLRRRIDDVEQTLMSAHLELLAALLVDVRRTVHGEFLDLGRQRNGSAHLRAGALCRIHDLARRRIEDAMVERLEPDADVLTINIVQTTEDRRRRTEKSVHVGSYCPRAVPFLFVCPLSSVVCRPITL